MHKKPIFLWVEPSADATHGTLSRRDAELVAALLEPEEEELICLSDSAESGVPALATGGRQARELADLIIEPNGSNDGGTQGLRFLPTRGAPDIGPALDIAIRDGKPVLPAISEADGEATDLQQIRQLLGLPDPDLAGVAATWDRVAQHKIPRIIIRQWYPLLLLLVIGRAPRRAEMLPARAAQPVPSSGSAVSSDDLAALGHRADVLANLFGLKYRSSFVGRFVLSAIVSVFAALTIIAYPRAKVYAFGLEFAATMTIIGSFIAATAGGWQRKWLTYRYIAESLRNLSAMPRAARQHLLAERRFPDDPVSDEERLLDWCARHVLTDPALWQEQKPGQRHAELAALLDGQIGYQTRKVSEQTNAENRLGKVGLASFLGTTTIAFIALVGSMMNPDLLTEYSRQISIALGILPALGAAIFAIRIQANFQSEAMQAGLMQTRLKALKSRLDACDPADGETLADLELRLMRLLQGEFGDWQKVQQGRGLALPG